MQNHVISNKQGSVLDMSPLKDAHGLVLALRPKGQKGDSKEITAEVAASEIVERVKKAGWVDVKPVSMPAPVAPPSKPAPVAPTPPAPPSPPAATAPPPPPAPPTTSTPPAAPPPTPVPPEATQVMPPAQVEKLVEETKTPESDPSQPVKRARK